MLRLVVVLLGVVPACLLAPPRPGADGDAGGGGGGGDGGMMCPCGDRPGDNLPGTMVVAGVAAGMPDRLIRAGTCGTSVQLRIHEPSTSGAGLDPRCPTIVVPDLVPSDSSGAPTVRALGTFGPDRAAVVIESPDGTTRVVSVDLATSQIVQQTTSTVTLAPGPAYVAGVPDDGTQFDNWLIYGVNSTVWLADMQAGPPVSLISPVTTMLPLVVAAPQRGGVVNYWALTGAVGEFEVPLSIPAVPTAPPFLLPAPCDTGGCVLVGHANEQLPVASGEIVAYAISEGGLLTVTVHGDAAKRRAMLDLKLGTAKVVDVAIGKITGESTWIAVLDDLGVVRAAPLTVTDPATPTVTAGPFATGTLAATLPAPRVVLGRFGADTLRIYLVSGAPDGGPREAACLMLSGSTLEPCVP